MGKEIIISTNSHMPIINLLCDDGTQYNIKLMSKIRGIKRKGRRPIGFFLDKNQDFSNVDIDKLLRWLQNEFKTIFDKDSEIFERHTSILQLR